MVTRAAKKQNVGFKIACTGTPVENTLADLWCLFDFVQPGLLGALNDFGQRLRRPIEAKDDEEHARVEELRLRISPQILRHTKAEVAKDLPQMIIVDACRKLPLSTTQRNLYAKAIEDFKKRNDPSFRSPFKNHLGLFQYLRLVCTDPKPLVEVAPPSTLLQRGGQVMQALPCRDRQYAPWNERLSEVMRSANEGRLPSAEAFDLAFDTVEILLALNSARPRAQNGQYWALPGRYGHRHQECDRILAKLRVDAGTAAAPGPLAMSGLIGTTPEEYETNLTSLVTFVQNLHWH